MPCEVHGERVFIRPSVFIVTDTSCLRHCEHIAASGWCGCSRDDALRKTPKKPASKEEMPQFLSGCLSFSRIDRSVLSHTIVDDEAVPRPCTAPGCKFAHNPDNALAEMQEMLDLEKLLSSDTSKAGKAKYSA